MEPAASDESAQPPVNQVDGNGDHEDVPSISRPQSDIITNELRNVTTTAKYHLDEVIPPVHSSRTIVLCFDGTGDQFKADVRSLSGLIIHLSYFTT